MGKTARLQKARPLGALRKTRRLFPPEFLFMHPLHVFNPVAAADVQPAIDRAAVDALLFPFAGGVERPAAARPAGTPPHDPVSSFFRAAALHQLANQLLTAVLTACQPGQRPVARLFRVETGLVLSQASASSGNASSRSAPDATTGAAMVARIFFSMSAAIAGFSFRNWRALSLPWPMRSLL